jgi:hypothetical protein
MNPQRAEYVTRDAVLKLLSDDEIASVSTSETAPRLWDGDEYVDLENLKRGVQKAGAVPTVMGRVLPRKAVLEETWHNIVKELQAHKIPTLYVAK